ncbi:hypothetical protein [Methylocystis sp. B8]|uniref:hypothetical protein n=1 Tax=Methylocystis sp. B8 TaxID=544938 RepID=UPI0010FDFA11|nr:hypothetical protein [Methylocystis sp. B8]TLG75159.1 hypothetical protein FEV16_11665 [Methylocystis sp. B8]
MQLYDEKDLEKAFEDGRREAASSSGDIDAAYARGVAAERERIKGVLTSSVAESDPRTAIMLVVSGVDATPENIAAVNEARRIAADASWAEINAKRTASPGRSF